MDKLWALAGRLGVLLRTLGWLYALALVTAAGALWAFAELADEVLEKETDGFNRALMQAVHAHATPVIDPWVLMLTQLGSVAAIVTIAAAVVGLFSWKGRQTDAVTLAVVVTGAGGLTWLLKHVFARSRPEVFKPLIAETGYSFPSGHSLLSFSLYGFLAAWLVLVGPRTPWRYVGAAALVFLAAAIALTRVYIGVHYPTDVLAGFLVALFWLSVCLVGRRWLVLRRGG